MEINGFNENMLMAEDADFAKRLKEWGKKIIRNSVLLKWNDNFMQKI